MTVSLDGSTRHPKIYAWTDPDHDCVDWQAPRNGAGLVKVGYTDRDDADTRIRESRGVKTPHAKPYTILLTEAAITDEGAAFKDHAIHAELERAGVRRVPAADGAKTEWFECTVDEVKVAIDAVRSGIRLESLRLKAKFSPRPEQQRAVEQTAAYFNAHSGDGPAHFLWNAKMRFGKTFATYQLAKELGWTRILVLTYKPAVETAWRDDLEGHVDFEGWRFKGKEDGLADLKDPAPLIWFASFQDVLGTDDQGHTKKKNEALYEAAWDVVVIDEYHFGAWRDAARSLYLADPDDRDLTGDKSEQGDLDTPDLDEDFAANLEAVLQLDVSRYLYLSGTPFRALTQGEFLEDQVYNWTYGDEQRAKTTWDGDAPNP